MAEKHCNRFDVGIWTQWKATDVFLVAFFAIVGLSNTRAKHERLSTWLQRAVNAGEEMYE